MTILRPYLLTLLSAVMVLTSGSFAVARSSDQTGERITICAGGVLTTIEIGPDGQPLAHAPICPDCTLANLALLPGSGSDAAFAATRAETALPEGPQRIDSFDKLPAQARGPPVQV